MAQYNRPPKAKAPKADEFVSFFDSIIEYFMLHQAKFWILVAVLAIGFSGYALNRYRIGQQMFDLATDYSQAEQAQAADSLKAWESVLSKNPPSPLRQVVDMQIGGAQAGQGLWEAASQSFQKSADSKSFTLWSVAKLANAVSLENAKKYPEAMAVYQEIAAMKDDPFRFRGKLGTARVYLEMNQPTEAENILLQLLVKSSDAPEPVKSAALSELVAMKAKTSSGNPETH